MLTGVGSHVHSRPLIPAREISYQFIIESDDMFPEPILVHIVQATLKALLLYDLDHKRHAAYKAGKEFAR